MFLLSRGMTIDHQYNHKLQTNIKQILIDLTENQKKIIEQTNTIIDLNNELKEEINQLKITIKKIKTKENDIYLAIQSLT